MNQNQKKINDTIQLETLNSQLSYLRDLETHEGWKFLKKEIQILISDIKEMLWKPCTDESKRFNSRNLLNERLAALFVFQNINDITIDKLKTLISHEEHRVLPLLEKLERDNQNMAEKLLREIKL